MKKDYYIKIIKQYGEIRVGSYNGLEITQDDIAYIRERASAQGINIKAGPDYIEVPKGELENLTKALRSNLETLIWKVLGIEK